MSRKIREIGFIGGGIDSGIGKTHYNSICLNRNWKLSAGFFSRNKKINILSGKKYNIPKNRIYSSIDSFLKNEKKIGAVSLLTPIPNRYNTIKKIIKNKIPIICEKPLLASIEESKKIKKILNKNFLTVTYNYTGYPMIRELENLIKKKSFFGKINSIFIEMPSGVFLEKKTKKENIAKWRLKDGKIPMSFLDLGSHVFNLMYFLTKHYPENLIAKSSTFGKFKNIKDDVMCFGSLNKNTNFNIWFSKSTLGYDNGLKIRIFGKKASVEWVQSEPEKLKINTNDKKNFTIDRGSYLSLISKFKRYNDFKSGHPTGFLEAFKNLYDDILQNIENYKKKIKLNKTYIFEFEHAQKILTVLDSIQKSFVSKKWIKLKK